MSHRDFIRRGGSNAWPLELVPGAQDFQRWDAAQASLINGINGGTWNPIKPITIGQTGANPNSVALTLNNAASQLTGGAVTSYGGRIVCAGAIPPGVTPSRSRTLTWHLWEMPIELAVPTIADDNVTLIQDPTRFGVTKTTAESILVVPAKYIHAGATLQSCMLNYRVTKKPTVSQMGSPNLQFIPTGLSPGGSFLSFPNNVAYALMSTAWAAAIAKTAGTYIVPTTTHATGFYYKATSIAGTGTTGATEPAWPIVVGGMVTDNPGANQIVWTCIGRNGGGTAKQYSDASTYYANGQLQSLTFQTDPAVANLIDPTAGYYVFVISIALYPLLHSIQLTYSGISTLAFE